jgi:recombination protein RecT
MAQTRQMNQLAEVRMQLGNMSDKFKAALPKHIPFERFVEVVSTAIRNSAKSATDMPELLDCDRLSLLNAAMRAAQDGLLPDGRYGAIVVYRDKKRGIKLAQWLPMIAGIRQKVRNSGEIATWSAHVVHERDSYDYEEGDNPHILHRPVRGDRGKIIAAYSIATLKSGEISREWMWIEELDKVRATSKAERGPWQDWPEEMYKKTVAKRHAKVLPMSTDLDDLLRRPDEPEDGDEGPAGGGESPREWPRPQSMTDALDMIAANTETKRKVSATAYKPTAEIIDELDPETGEVIDQGEYAPSDDELPLGQEEGHRDSRA